MPLSVPIYFALQWKNASLVSSKISQIGDEAYKIAIKIYLNTAFSNIIIVFSYEKTIDLLIN